MKLVAFDLDGTLVDSDEALIAPFLACGVARSALPPLGLLLEEACAQAGIPTQARALTAFYQRKLADTAAAVDAGYPGNTDLVLEDGRPVLRRRKSTFIYGIEDDAREVIDHLARYLQTDHPERSRGDSPA